MVFEKVWWKDPLLLSDWCLYFLSTYLLDVMWLFTHRWCGQVVTGLITVCLISSGWSFLQSKMVRKNKSSSRQEPPCGRIASQRDATCVTCHMEYLTILDGVILVFTGLQKQQSSVSILFILWAYCGAGTMAGTTSCRPWESIWVCTCAYFVQNARNLPKLFPCAQRISQVWRTKDFSQSKAMSCGLLELLAAPKVMEIGCYEQASTAWSTAQAALLELITCRLGYQANQQISKDLCDLTDRLTGQMRHTWLTGWPIGLAFAAL